MKSWIAINLKDFHSQNKKWQGGKSDNVRIKVVAGDTLEKAKKTAQMDNNDAWLVYNLNTTKNIIYGNN